MSTIPTPASTGEAQEPDKRDARWHLASRMVTTLPAFGNWATHMRDFDTPLGKIGYRQAEVLYCLRKQLLGPEPASPSSLASAFNVRPSAMTRVLARLELPGFIERRTDPIDRRAQTLHITPEGEAISIVVEEMVVKRMAEALAIVPAERLPLLAEHIELLREIALILQQDGDTRLRTALDPGN